MTTTPPVTATYLTDDVIGLRAPVIDDAVFAHRWYEGPATHGRDEVERALVRQESIPWGGNPVLRLIGVEIATGDIVAGVVIIRSSNRASGLTLVCPEDNDRAEYLRRVLALVVPWLLDEVGLMTVVLQTPADDLAMVQAAEGAGMTFAVRRREHIRRPSGRVDLLDLERVNLDWGRYAG